LGRIAKFENYRFLGNRKNMRVYDCDNQEEFAQIENLINDKDLIINNLIQAFAPDNIHEAKNRGFKPF
jgi:hypothetical protein|tara:strand:- start:1004 stop:1207 length:204 start_codon:yes stop_codon:yes gene_type:complete